MIQKGFSIIVLSIAMVVASIIGYFAYEQIDENKNQAPSPIVNDNCGLTINTTNGQFSPQICEFQIITPGEECGLNEACPNSYVINMEDSNVSHIRQVTISVREFKRGAYVFDRYSKEFNGELLDKNFSSRGLLEGEIDLTPLEGNNIRINFNATFDNGINIIAQGIIPVKHECAP